MTEGTGVPAPGARTIVLAAEPSSAAAARQFVRDLLRGSRHYGLEDVALLCVTELVANVSCHTDSTDCVVTVVDEAEDLLIEVADTAGDLPAMESPSRMSEHGRGLRIIDALAGEWGVRRRPAGKAVWVRLT